MQHDSTIRPVPHAILRVHTALPHQSVTGEAVEAAFPTRLSAQAQCALAIVRNQCATNYNQPRLSGRSSNPRHTCDLTQPSCPSPSSWRLQSAHVVGRERLAALFRATMALALALALSASRGAIAQHTVHARYRRANVVSLQILGRFIQLAPGS